MPNLDPLLQFYQIFMEQSDDGIWMVDLDIPLDLSQNDEEKLHHFTLHGLIRRCNAAFARDQPPFVVPMQELVFSSIQALAS